MHGPFVETGAIIGANVTLLPGVRIGAGALVGAGAVVINDVRPGTVVVGNPARVVRNVDELAAYRAQSGVQPNTEVSLLADLGAVLGPAAGN